MAGWYGHALVRVLCRGVLEADLCCRMPLRTCRSPPQAEPNCGPTQLRGPALPSCLRAPPRPRNLPGPTRHCSDGRRMRMVIKTMEIFAISFLGLRLFFLLYRQFLHRSLLFGSLWHHWRHPRLVGFFLFLSCLRFSRDIFCRWLRVEDVQRFEVRKGYFQLPPGILALQAKLGH